MQRSSPCHQMLFSSYIFIMDNDKDTTYQSHLSMDTIVTASCKPIFVAYLLIAANFLGTLFSCQTQRLLQQNQFIRHTIGFITVYMFVIVSGDNDDSKATRLLRFPMALAVYVSFVLSTKMRHTWWIAFIVILLIANVIQIVHDEVGNASETNLDGWTVDQNSAIRITQVVLLCIAMVVIVVGFIAYLHDKKQEYGDKFRLITFMLGRPECNNNGMGDQKTS
jgi:hypothetical protein